jgi:hypothetical protein
MPDTHVLRPRIEDRVVRRVVPETVDVRRSGYAAFKVLQLGFVLAPLIAGVDKFFHGLVEWPIYLAPTVERLLPMSGASFMRLVGVVEVAAAVLVAVAPRIGGWVVAAWLWAIIFNLLLVPGYYDIALRDVGLSLGAVALALLGRAHARPLPEPAGRPEARRTPPAPDYPPFVPPPV